MIGTYTPTGTGSWNCEWCGLWFDTEESQRYIHGRIKAALQNTSASVPCGSGPYCLSCLVKLQGNIEIPQVNDKITFC